MGDALKLLAEIKDKIGFPAVLFVVISFLILAFSKEAGASISPDYASMISVGAAIFFAVGLLIAILSVLGGIFSHRPARGLFDGLVSGILASLVGGYFGFGFHSGPYYTDPRWVRVALCAIYTIPTGAVLGLIFDLFQSDRAIPWKQYFAVLLLVIFTSIALIVWYVLNYMHTMQGVGITLSDLFLLFEAFAFFSILITSVQFNWTIGRFIWRILLLAIIDALARLLLVSVPASPDWQHLYCDKLFCLEFIADVNGQAMFGTALIVMILWVILTYAFLIVDHRLNTLCDASFSKEGPPTS